MIYPIKGKQTLHQTSNRRVYIMNVIKKFAREKLNYLFSALFFNLIACGFLWLYAYLYA